MLIDRAEMPSAADYVRRACAFCCGQVTEEELVKQALANKQEIVLCLLPLPLTIQGARYPIAAAGFPV